MHKALSERPNQCRSTGFLDVFAISHHLIGFDLICKSKWIAIVILFSHLLKRFLLPFFFPDAAERDATRPEAAAVSISFAAVVAAMAAILSTGSTQQPGSDPADTASILQSVKGVVFKLACNLRGKPSTSALSKWCFVIGRKKITSSKHCVNLNRMNGYMHCLSELSF
jgi:hypothetical protein